MRGRDFPSYGMSSDQGDIAVHRMVTCIVTDMHAGRCRRVELEARLHLGCVWVQGIGHREVWDEGTQSDIQAMVNRSCLTLDWPTASRRDWAR